VQAALNQAEIPAETGKSGDGGLVLAVALALLVMLGTGYEAMSMLRGGSAKSLPRGMGSAELVELLLTPDSMKEGPDSAPIKIVDFSDLLCPSCRAIYPDVKKLVKESNGKIQLIFRHRPLMKNTSHQMAMPAAFFAEYAAEKGDGWRFVDEMYQHDVLDIQTMAQLSAVATKVGIDVKDAQSRMNPEDPLWKKVMRDLNAAEELDVSETPTFIILAPGIVPAMAGGRELLNTIKRPSYQELIHPDGK
jgi:predicted DsbA family dithiol-disulfide isomerase